MIVRHPAPRSFALAFQQCLLKPYSQAAIRTLHARASASQPPIPQPTPFVPDPSTFLKLIGRNLSQHSAKIPTWPSLFSLTGTQLRELGVEPARRRRYLLWWRERFRKGVFGIGGDLKNIKDGAAELRLVEVPVSQAAIQDGTSTEPAAGLLRMKKMIVNETEETLEENVDRQDLKAVEGMKVLGANTIVGPYVQPVKGTSGMVATIKIEEGMWEVKRGVKVDGGERRKVQVRRKRLLQERKTKRI